jgi:hypothetical protein
VDDAIVFLLLSIDQMNLTPSFMFAPPPPPPSSSSSPFFPPGSCSILSGALSIIAPHSPKQLFVGLLICASFFTLVVRLSPYVDDSHDILSCFTFLTLTLTMLVGAVKSAHDNGSVPGTDKEKRPWQDLDPDALGSILIAINCIPIVYFAIDIFRWFVCPRKHTGNETTTNEKKKNSLPATTSKFGDRVAPASSLSSSSSSSESSSSIVQITPFVPPPPPPSRLVTNEEHVEALMKESEEHERGHRKKQAVRRDRSQRRTMARVKARAKLKKSKRMKKVELFAQLDEDAISRLVDAMKLERFQHGETILEEGSTGDNSFYVIVEGNCSVKKHGHTVGMLHEFEHFGESSLVALIQGELQARNASVVSNSEGGVQVLSLNAITLRALMEDGTVDRGQLMLGVHTAQLRRGAREHWGTAQRGVDAVRSLFS